MNSLGERVAAPLATRRRTKRREGRLARRACPGLHVRQLGQRTKEAHDPLFHPMHDEQGERREEWNTDRRVTRGRRVEQPQHQSTEEAGREYDGRPEAERDKQRARMPVVVAEAAATIRVTVAWLQGSGTAGEAKGALAKRLVRTRRSRAEPAPTVQTVPAKS